LQNQVAEVKQNSSMSCSWCAIPHLNPSFPAFCFKKRMPYRCLKSLFNLIMDMHTRDIQKNLSLIACWCNFADDIMLAKKPREAVNSQLKLWRQLRKQRANTRAELRQSICAVILARDNNVSQKKLRKDVIPHISKLKV